MNLSFLKLDVNFMDDAKIKLIRKMPEGDSIIVLWLGLMCLAMKSGRPGVAQIGDGIPFNEETLASVFDMNINIVRLGLEIFTRYRMVEIWEDGEVFLINFEKHQNLEKIEKAREISRESSKKYREKVKGLIGDGHVTISDETEEDKDKEKKRKEIEQKKETAKKVIDYLNKKTGKKFRYGDANLKHIMARINEKFEFPDFCKVVDLKIKDPHFIENPQYLSPDTLFGNKFEKYLNSGGVKDSSPKTQALGKEYQEWSPHD